MTPDINLPSLLDYLDIGEASLENCLPADNTTPATYSTLNRVSPYLPELQKLSRERISEDKDFAYLLEACPGVDHLVLDDQFAQFLTLPGYDKLD